MNGPEALCLSMARNNVGCNELQRKLGAANGSASGWRSGRVVPSVRYAVALEDLFGIPVRAWVRDSQG